MDNAQFKITRREAYLPPPFLVESIHLVFRLHETRTQVAARSLIRKNPDRVSDSDSLVLYGEKLQLESILLDGNEVAPDLIEVDDHQLTIAPVPDSFLLEITTTINPQDNTSLSGLYLSSGIFCTQCEAEGFRRITYYPDRPDVLARFTTRIEADRNRFPVLLANGNLESSGQMDDGFHFAEWHDPFPKPCYLFALVAGDLAAHSDTFTTRSGRAVDLYIYTEHRNQGTCAHAMESLKKAMRWDEETFGLEYDLDRYMIVAVDDFNMGAMENKGLNIFNSKYVLASQETATDQDYLHIEGVIAHEYFHNWTGNRVTCRDWFQLSLKEGLTVFRDQQFSADMNSRAVQRIKDVRLLRHYQFREDEGPMAHPVRPDTYMEINNFYTVTVYNKGAEVVRMIHTLLGPEEFRKGMDLYFARHDGQAVTCDDFVAAMADASGRDLCRFKRWYSQAGTPVIECIERWDEKTGTLRITVRQHTPATPGQPYKQPFHLPILCGFIDACGNDVSQSITCGYRSQGQDILLELTEHEQDFVFSGFAERPVVSLFRFFSAPVKISPFQTKGQTAVLMSHDSDPFNRWDASFSYCSSAIVELVESSSEVRNTVLDGDFTNAMGSFISDKGGDDALNALALQLPEESFLALSLRDVDPDRLHDARTHIKHQLGISLFDTFLSAYQSRNDDRNYDISSEAIGRRSLKNTCLDYLVCVHDVHPETVELARDQYFRADNMTDQMAVLASVSHISGDVREELFGNFETRWLDNPLVMDKWFSLQALSATDDTLERVKKLLTHKAFSIKNPNKVRSLIGAFSQNHVRFHQDNGSGYHFLADKILEVDRLNPQIAARLAGPLISWQRYEPLRKSLMKQTLATIKSTGRLSRDVYEIVSKGLEG